MSETKTSQLKVFEMFGTSQKNQEQCVKNEYSRYKKITTKLQALQFHLSKISKSYAEINIHLSAFHNNLSQQSWHDIDASSTKCVAESIVLINSKISDNLAELSNRMSSFLAMYSAQMKKNYGKFMDSWENVDHYRLKMKGLSSNTPDSLKYERNRSKLNQAEEEFEINLLTFSKTLKNVSNEAERLLSDCFKNSLVNMADNYQQLEHDILAELNTMKIQKEDFSVFLGQKFDTNQPKTFLDKLKKHTNKRSSQNTDQNLRIKIAKYFSQKTSESVNGRPNLANKWLEPPKDYFRSFDSMMATKPKNVKKSPTQLRYPASADLKKNNDLNLLDL